MEIHVEKLKIQKFQTFAFVNFPNGLLNQDNDANPEVIFYYVDSNEDVAKFAEYCNNAKLPKENRTIIIYKKGRKDGVNRDSIIAPFKAGKYPQFIAKAPMMCAFSEELTALILMKV